jgi:Tfp pilus assembly protein PilF
VVAVLMAGGAVLASGAAIAQSMWDDPAFVLYRQAAEAMERRSFADAEALAAKAIAQYPDHALAYYLRGQAAAQSHWDDAATSLGKAVALYPGSVAARRDLGAVLERQDRFADAAQAYAAALDIRDSDELRVRLAYALAEAGDEPRALGERHKLTDRDTALPEAWSLLARITYGDGDWAAAEKAYARAAALRDNGRTWFNLGVVRVRLNDLPGALQAFERAAKHPDVKTQADAEASRVRAAIGGSRRRVASVTDPGTGHRALRLITTMTVRVSRTDRASQPCQPAPAHPPVNRGGLTCARCVARSRNRRHDIGRASAGPCAARSAWG